MCKHGFQPGCPRLHSARFAGNLQQRVYTSKLMMSGSQDQAHPGIVDSGTQAGFLKVA